MHRPRFRCSSFYLIVLYTVACLRPTIRICFGACLSSDGVFSLSVFSINKSHFLNWIREKWSRPKYLHGHSHTYQMYHCVASERGRWFGFTQCTKWSQPKWHNSIRALHCIHCEWNEYEYEWWAMFCLAHIVSTRNKRCEMDGNATHIYCMHKTANLFHSLRAKTFSAVHSS